MFNITQKRFALVCAFSLSLLSFWSDIVASSASSSSSSSSSAAAAASSSNASAAQPRFEPLLLDERIAAGSKDDERGLSVLRACCKECVVPEVVEARSKFKDERSEIAQLHKEYWARHGQLCQEFWTTNDKHEKDSLRRDMKTNEENFKESRDSLFSRDPGNVVRALNLQMHRGKYFENLTIYLAAQHKTETVRSQQREQALLAENQLLRSIIEKSKGEIKPQTHGGPLPKSKKKEMQLFL